MSQDYELSEAIKWAQQVKPSWPTVLTDDQQTTSLTKFGARGLPHYILVSDKGEIAAQGLEDCTRRINALR